MQHLHICLDWDVDMQRHFVCANADFKVKLSKVESW